MKVLGTPLGHPQFVKSFLRATNEAHAVLVNRIPAIPDLQSAWLVLLFCASTRANYLLRALHTAATQDFASVHDNASRACLSHLLDNALSDDRWDLASLPFYLGGLGLCNASRSRFAAHWSSWADCLEMVKSRHPPPIAAVILDALDSHHPGHHFTGARTAREHLLEASFDVPSWEALANGFPSAPHAHFDSQPFLVVLLRRLWLPLPLSSRSCRCGRPLDSSGHHRAACAVAGVLGSRGFTLESAAARVCREAGGRVSTNVRVQDMDLAAPNPLDNRRIEVVVDGLPLFHGAQLAVDTTLVSPLRRDGTPHPRCANVDGAALDTARHRKETTYPGAPWAQWPHQIGCLGC